MAMWQKSGLNEVTHLWKMYESGIDYQIRTGLRSNIPKYIDFYEGRQWPCPTENTKNLPRPVVNIVKMICRSKKSSILSTPVKILYKSYSPKTDTSKLNDFADSIQKEMNQFKPAIRDAVITNLSSKTSAELASAAGKELAKEQISNDINSILGGEREVLRVSFGQFIIQ